MRDILERARHLAIVLDLRERVCAIALGHESPGVELVRRHESCPGYSTPAASIAVVG